MNGHPVRTRPSAATLLALAAASLLCGATPSATADQAALRSALTFYAGFDGKIDAVHALGDPTMYSAPTFARRQEAAPGLPATGEIVTAPAEGRFGDALRFTTRRSPIVFFRAARNMSYTTTDWGGTISFWLSVDPEMDLETGFCDPIQITPNAWNNAAFFVEFEKRPEGIPFRLGVYADLDVWNPTGRRISDVPTAERPLVPIDTPPFRRGKWTHVAVAFERFNTRQPDGVARLYTDGQLMGTLSPREQTFTWDLEKTAVALGSGYIGLFDELALFNRALTGDEIAELYRLDRGVASLLR